MMTRKKYLYLNTFEDLESALLVHNLHVGEFITSTSFTYHIWDLIVEEVALAPRQYGRLFGER